MMAADRRWLPTRRIVAALLAGTVLTLGGCSAQGSIGTDDNGVKVGGDVDAKE